MTGDFLPAKQTIGKANSLQPVKKANAPLRAALEAAKAARLPDHMEAQLSRIGVMAPKPAQRETPRPIWTGPTNEQPDPPF
jgi:hypothetical protein